jgi:MFS family permease
MTRTLLTIALLLPVAALAVWQVGGLVELRGAGVALGYAVGALVSVWGIYLQRHTLRHRPERMTAASAIDFGTKLVVVLVGAALPHLVPRVAELWDWRSFLLSFAVVSVATLIVGTADAVKALSRTAPAASLDTPGQHTGSSAG